MPAKSTARWVFLSLLASGTVQGQGGWWDTRFDLPGANGRIQSLVEFRGALYAVGSFTRIAGVNAPGVARWDGTRWTAIAPGLNAAVSAAVATDEAIYFAAYRQETNQPAGLLRWDGQTWSALGTPRGYRDVTGDPLITDGTNIYAEAFPDITPGGSYWTLAAGKWDGRAWSILAATRYVGANSLNGLAVAQGNLYASGGIITTNPQVALNLGRLVQTNWVPVGGGVGEGLSVFDIASDGPNLLVQGSFRTVGSQPADGFAIWDGARWIAPSAESRHGARVDALTSNPGEVLASEVVTTNTPFGEQRISQHLVQYIGTNRTVLARGDASMDLMRRTSDGIYVTGTFRDVGGVPTGNLALWTGSRWTRVGSGNFQGLTDEATTVAVAETNVFVAGYFRYAGDTPANHIARWDGRKWHALGSGITGTVAQIVTRGTDLFVAGAFDSAGGVSATNLAQWDGVNWLSLGGGLSGELTALAASEHYLWVARKIAPTNFVVSRWNGAAWSDVAGGTFGYSTIHALLATDDSVLIGGSFDRIDGVLVNHIARWAEGQWQTLGAGLSGLGPWSPNDYPFAEVRALLQDGPNLYVGGSFTKAGTGPALNVARWDGAQWSALGEGIPGFGSCLFGSCIYPVTSLALVRGQLFAGGGYTVGNSLYQLSRGHLARWTGTTWTNVVAGDWARRDTGPPYRFPGELHVWALAAQRSDLFVAGNFATIDEIPSHGFGIWHGGEPLTVHANLRANRLVLSCPREFQNAAIESAESLASPAWTAVLGVTWTLSTTNPNEVEAELTPSSSRAFFRLRWPE